MFIGVEHLIGTRVIYCGAVASSAVPTAGSPTTVVFPQPLPGASTDYAIFTGGVTGTCYADSVAFVAASGANNSFPFGFNLYATIPTGGAAWWEVVRVTNASITAGPPGLTYQSYLPGPLPLGEVTNY